MGRSDRIDGWTSDGQSRRAALAAGAALGAGLVAGCLSGGSTDSTSSGTAVGGWRSTELTDVLTGETFTVGGFDTPVVLEIFAVWCPVCTNQQRELGALKGSLGSDVTVVSLNIDPNEDAAKVRKHATDHGFDWHYAVSPSGLTRALSDRFGNVITNPPSAPVVRVCRDGPAELIEGRGVKPASTIRAALDEC